MGFIGDLFRSGKMQNPVGGTARVVSCSQYQGRGAVRARCRLQLVVEAEGVPATAVEREELVHRERWPSPGIVLPVTVDRADPTNVSINWDAVPSSRDRTRQTAEGLAAALRGEPSTGAGPGAAGGLGTPMGGPYGGVEVINLSGGSLSEEQKAKLRMLGVDPDAVASQSGPPPSSPPPPPARDSGTDQKLERLEKLAELLDRGVLTEAEFQAEKQKILDS